MAADTYSSILGFLIMGLGNDNNAWGTNAVNSIFTPLEAAICGVNTITNTSGTVDLSTILPPAGLRLDVAKIQLANGALTGNLTIKVPNLSKTWEFWNQTSGAFNMYVQVPGGVARTGPNAPGGLVEIPQGCKIKVACDGNGNLLREDDALIGTFSISAKAAAGPGELACDGTSDLRATHPDLFGKIGTTWGSADGTHYTRPLLTDTNRYLRAGGGSGPAVGTYQSNQNASHTHTVTGAPSAGTLGTDSQGSHTHSASSSDSGHVHSYLQAVYATITGGGSFNAASGNSGANTGTGFANISTSIGSAGAHTHNITGAPGLGSLATASQGGTEARPESAAALICIRY